MRVRATCKHAFAHPDKVLERERLADVPRDNALVVKLAERALLKSLVNGEFIDDKTILSGKWCRHAMAR